MSSGGDGIISPAFTGSGNDIEKVSEGKIGITWQNRPGQSALQWFCLLIYIAIAGLFIVQGSLAVSQQNMMVMHPSQECPGDWWRRPGSFNAKTHWCMSPNLKEAWDKCYAKLAPIYTELGKEEKQKEDEEVNDEEVKKEDMWALLGSNVGITATIFPSIIVFAVGWFFLLKHFPRFVVYGTIFAGVMILIAMAILNIMEHPTKDVNAGSGNLICAAVVITFTLIMKKQISFVCRVVAAACKILKLRLSIFFAAFVLKLIWAAVIALALWFLVASSQIVEIKDNSVGTMVKCSVVMAGHNYYTAPAFVFIMISVFFEMSLGLLSAVGIGGYYFHRNDPLAPTYPAFTALGWAFSRSAGAVAESSIIVTLLRWAEQWLNFSHGWAWMCVLNPFWWALKCLWCCLENLLSTVSRFLVVMHGFHGGDFSTDDPRRPRKEALLKHLGTAFVNGVVGQEILSFSASLLATVIGIGAQFWLDQAEEIFMLTQHPQLWKGIPILYLVLADSFYKWGLATLVLLTLFWEAITLGTPMPKYVACIFVGLFISFVSKIVIQFFVDVVFHATDGLLYCYVLDQEAGNPVSEDMKEIHDIVQDSKSGNTIETEELQPIKPNEGGEGYGAADGGGGAQGSTESTETKV